MAKVEHRKARKDYPKSDIKAGEMYYYVCIKTGPRSSKEMRSKTPFKRSQLTLSEYLSQAYDLQDSLAAVGDLDEAQMIADSLRELGEEQEEKFSNMPDGLQQGDTGQMLEERAANCSAAADEIEELINEWNEDEAREEVISDVDEEPGMSEAEIQEGVDEKLADLVSRISDVCFDA